MAKALQRIKTPPAPLAPLSPELAALAEKASSNRAKEVLGVPRISHKSGQIRVDNKPVDGNKLKLVVLDYIGTKSYFPNGYVEGKPATPTCYAYDETGNEADMKPHPASPDPQNATCNGCKHNVFGTALINGQPGGKGKRCKDERKVLVTMPVNDPDGLRKAEVRQISVPPASLKSFGAYLSTLADVTPYGVNGVVTELGTEPAGGSYRLTFRPTDQLALEVVSAIAAKQASLRQQMVTPWPVLTDDTPMSKADKAKNAARAGKR